MGTVFETESGNFTDRGIQGEQFWVWDRGRVVSPGLLFSAGAAWGLRNQMALFCFPDEPAQPLARSQYTNTVWREEGGGGKGVVKRIRTPAFIFFTFSPFVR